MSALSKLLQLLNDDSVLDSVKTAVKKIQSDQVTGANDTNSGSLDDLLKEVKKEDKDRRKIECDQSSVVYMFKISNWTFKVLERGKTTYSDDYWVLVKIGKAEQLIESAGNVKCSVYRCLSNRWGPEKKSLASIDINVGIPQALKYLKTNDNKVTKSTTGNVHVSQIAFVVKNRQDADDVGFIAYSSRERFFLDCLPRASTLLTSGETEDDESADDDDVEFQIRAKFKKLFSQKSFKKEIRFMKKSNFDTCRESFKQLAMDDLDSDASSKIVAEYQHSLHKLWISFKKNPIDVIGVAVFDDEQKVATFGFEPESKPGTESDTD